MRGGSARIAPAALAAALSVCASGCVTLQVDTAAFARIKRVVLVGFLGNRDVELALANQQFIQSRHDGEDVLPKAMASFAEQLYRAGRFTLLPPTFITSSSGYREYRPSRFRYRREFELVSAPVLKLVNGEADGKAIGALVKAAGVDAGIVVECSFSTEVRIAEGDTGSAGGRTRMRIWMWDSAGRLAWSDYVEGNSETLARVSGGTYTFPNEIAKVVLEGFERATEDAVARLRKRLG